MDDSSGVWGRLRLLRRSLEGVLKNECDLITKPTFYPDLRSAAMSGFGMMKQLYPLYDDNLFNEFLSEIPE